MFEGIVVPPCIELIRLRQLTERAVTLCGIREERLAAAATDEEREALKVEEVIERIPYLCEMRARAGEYEAEIMVLTGSAEFDCQALHQPLQGEAPLEIEKVRPEWLFGTARIVWEYCRDASFNPTLKFWTHCGMAQMWGYAIVVHW